MAKKNKSNEIGKEALQYIADRIKGIDKNGKKPCKEITYAIQHVAKHFGKMNPDDLVTASRTYPATSRVDLQCAIDKLFEKKYNAKLLGIHKQYIREALSFSELLTWNHDPVVIGPLQHDEVDIGEENPVRCLQRGLWLAKAGRTKFALVMGKNEGYVSSGTVTVEIAVPPGVRGLKLSQKIMKELEDLVAESTSYRGKVISLESQSEYTGASGSVKVHKIRSVDRSEVILPAGVLDLLDRNVMDFVKMRKELRRLKMPVKKGILLYGVPGTGKTHTAHYLANQLPDHTTLLITSAQVGLLPEYFYLARFLQPSMVIIEDVDLIARQRADMRSACEETLLNYLLNEMDGLREDAEILFILTTNHPEMLESALASRPGRIDQAIEFPLPDEEGRKKLVKLYSRDLKVSAKLTNLIVKRTDQATPAFIKELMRRSAQYLLADDGSSRTKNGNGNQNGGRQSKRNGTKPEVTEEQINKALEDMLFAGGSLNRTLLGGTAVRELGFRTEQT